MKKLFVLPIVFALSVVVFPCAAWADFQVSEVPSIQVYGTPSLSKVMPDLQNAYAASQSGVVFENELNVSSGEILWRIMSGESPDAVLITSSTMKRAVEDGLIAELAFDGEITSELVMVTARTRDDIDRITLSDIASGRFTICFGDDSVPSGNLANQALSTVGCFVDPEGKLGSESAGQAKGTDAYAGTPIQGKVVLCTSVSNTLACVEDEKADIAIVTLSDLIRFGADCKLVGMVPSDTHAPSSFSGAVVPSGAKKAEAKSFLDFCCSAEAQPILKKWGFNCTSIEDYESYANRGNSARKIDFPKAGSFVYDGKAKVALKSTGEYVVSGVSTAVNAGKYVLSVTPRNGYAWRDDSRDSIKLNWEIKAAKPTFKIKNTSKKVSLSKAKKKPISFKMGASVNSRSEIAYKVLKRNPRIIFKSGKVTLKSGRYTNGASFSIKVRVKCAAKGNYTAGHKDVNLAFSVKH